MIADRIQLFCDAAGCKKCYPADGPVNHDLFTAAELRASAKRHGWTRRNSGQWTKEDICPDHDAAKLTSILNAQKEIDSVPNR